jgi:hypothetical protein
MLIISYIKHGNMKNHKNITKKLLGVTITMGLLSILLSSCLKDRNNVPNPPAAQVAFIQASPDEPPLDFFLNSDRVNTRPINFGSGIDYFRAYVGTRTANFYNHFTMGKIFSDTVQLKQNVTYSLFLTNTAASPQILLLTDSLQKPASGNAGIRFINLSPDAPAVDLALQGGSVLVANKTFKNYSSFLPIAAKSGYNLEVRKAGTNTVLSTLLNVTLSNGRVYTIWLQGLVTPTKTTDSLSTSYVTNAIY